MPITWKNPLICFDEKPKQFLVALGYWFIINGVLSRIGAALARGHIYPVLTAFSVSHG